MALAQALGPLLSVCSWPSVRNGHLGWDDTLVYLNAHLFGGDFIAFWRNHTYPLCLLFYLTQKTLKRKM